MRELASGEGTVAEGGKQEEKDLAGKEAAPNSAIQERKGTAAERATVGAGRQELDSFSGKEKRGSGSEATENGTAEHGRREEDDALPEVSNEAAAQPVYAPVANSKHG